MTVLALLCLAAALCWILPRLRAPSAPADPQVVIYGDSAPADGQAPIPRQVWTYWHDGELPRVVQCCIAGWRRLNPGYRIELVSARNLLDFVEAADLPAGFGMLTPARQSDWVRLYLLRRHGGIWLDASIILTRSLDWLLEIQARAQAEFVGFHLERYAVPRLRPVVDSWCLAAPAGSAFIRDWYEEFTNQALRTGDAAYLQRLHEQGLAAEVIQNIPSPDYLMIHVCAQRVLQRGGAYRLRLVRAEDSAYFFQSKGRWKRPLLFLSLLILRPPHHPPALIKLRGGERRKLEAYLRRGWYSRNGLIGSAGDAAA